MNRGHVLWVSSIALLVAAGSIGWGQSRSADSHSAVGWVHGSPAKFLPRGKTTVDIVTDAPNKRFQQLAGTIREAAAKDPTWFQSHIKAVQPGEPLPYDSRLGLSEKEYKEFLELSAKPQRVQKTAEASLTVTQVTRTRYRLDGGPDLPYLTGIEFDVAAQVVRTPFGMCSKMHIVNAGPSQRLTGPFNGYEWTYRKGRLDELADVNKATFTSVQIVLGGFTQADRGILYYRARDVIVGEYQASPEVMITFPLGKR